MAYSLTLTALVCLLATLVTSQDDEYAHQRDQKYWKELGKQDVLRALEVKNNYAMPKNVIIFMGDGMGPNTVTAARVFRSGESSSLAFENFPTVGLLKTYAVDATVPDSACTATALFTGVKANFETVGVDGRVKLKDCEAAANKSHHVSSIMQWAQDAGKATGFVTNTRVTHATPSSLYAHSADRRWECENSLPPTATQCKDIARQLVEDEPGKNFQVIMGGGRQTLQAGGLSSGDIAKLNQWSCARNDSRDLIQKWKEDKIARQLTHAVLHNSGDLRNLDWRTEYVMGIFSNSHMLYEDQRDTSDSGSPSLADMARAAIQVLKKNDKGFVLLVEGGMIDQAHHIGHLRRALVETVKFHEAVEVGLDMTDSSDTLIIVTADHAHGLTINGIVDTRNNILGNTIPTKAGDKMPNNILTYIVGPQINFPYKVTDGQLVREDPKTMDKNKPDYAPQAGLLNDEVMHGGVDVAIYATGPMAHLFHGVHEQTHVAHAIAYALGIGEFKDSSNVKLSKKNAATFTRGSNIVLVLCVIIYMVFNSRKY